MPKQEEQGTGKHPHKSSEEPFEHHEAQSESGGKSKAAGAGSHGSASHESKSSEESKGDSDSSDLKSREYTDAQGNVHHHTRTYQDQHGKK